MRKNQIYPTLLKIISSFLIITILPIFIIAYFFYPKIHNILSSTIERSIDDYTQLAVDTLDTEFGNILQSGIDLKTLLDQTAHEPSNYVYHLNMQRNLEMIASRSALVEQVIIYEPNADEIFTTGGTISSDFFLKSLYHCGPQEEAFNPFSELSGTSPQLLSLQSFAYSPFNIKPSDYLAITYPLQTNQWAIFFIPECRIRKMINALSAESRNYVLYCQNTVLVSNSANISETELQNVVLQDEYTDPVLYQIHSKNCIFLNIRFQMIERNSIVYAELNRLLQTTLLIIFLIVVTGTLLMLYLIRSNYKPLMSILQCLTASDFKTAPFSGTEYDIIQDSIYTMQSVNRELSSTLKNYRENYKNLFLYELLSQSIQNITDISNIEERLETELYGRVLVPVFICYQETISNNKDLFSIVKNLNHHFCNHRGSNIQAVFSSCAEKNAIFTLFSLSSPISTSPFEQIHRFLKDEIFSFPMVKLPGSFYVVVGNTCNDIYNTREPIQILYQLLDSEFVENYSAGAVIDIQNSIFSPVSSRQPMYTIYNLTHAVDNRNISDINECMERIYKILLSKETSFSVAKLLFGQAMYILNTVTVNSDSHYLEKHSSELYTANQMTDILAEEQRRLEFVFAEDEKSIKSHRRDVKTYIDQHFMDSDFSISLVAEHYHMQVSNFSTYFKSEYHITFQQYCSEKKVKIAQTLLTQADLTLDEISDRLGYANASSFSRSFKREMQMTPGEYRKSIQIQQKTSEM